MILRASSLDEITNLLAGASAREERVTSFDLRAFQRVIEHNPEDLTVKVEAIPDLRGPPHLLRDFRELQLLTIQRHRDEEVAAWATAPFATTSSA